MAGLELALETRLASNSQRSTQYCLNQEEEDEEEEEGVKGRGKKKELYRVTFKKFSSAWWCTPLIPVLGRQRQADF